MADKSANVLFTAQLIDEYKSLPSLWEVENENYKNKQTKAADYERLWTTLKMLDPDLSMGELKRRIAVVRTCYRRELKKVFKSIKSGARGHDIYVPSLWYFDDMDFLRDQEPKTPGPSRSSVFGRTVHEYDEIPMVTSDASEATQSPVPRNHKTKTRSSKAFKKSFVKKNSFVKKCSSKRGGRLDHSNEPQIQPIKDDAIIFSETWAVLFRKLSPDQQLFGKRYIDEILYQGQLGNLAAHSYRFMEEEGGGPRYLAESGNSAITPHQMHTTSNANTPSSEDFKLITLTSNEMDPSISN